MPTNFQKVTNWNIAIGNPKGNPVNFSKERVAKQLLNIPDELGETFIALGADEKRVKALVTMFKAGLAALDYPNTMDVNEVRDGLIDQHVFLYGAHHIMGIDADEDMESVVQALYTRFIKNPEDEIATIKKHAKNGIIDICLEGDYPVRCLKSASDQPDAPTGKFLKSASFTAPKLLPVPKHVSVAPIFPQTVNGNFYHEAEQAVLGNSVPIVELPPMKWLSTEEGVTYTFHEFVQYGRDHGGNIVNGMPWSFKFHGIAVTHHSDTEYLLGVDATTYHLHENQSIIVYPSGQFDIMETELFNDAPTVVSQGHRPIKFQKTEDKVVSDMNDEARKLLDRHNANINGGK